MKYTFQVILVLFVGCNASFAQESREQKLRSVAELNSKLLVLQEQLVKPDERDISAARSRRLSAVRLLPRGLFSENSLERGGGAFFSFSTGSHSYDRSPQVLLEKDELRSGFYGSNFGLFADLGDVAVEDISRERAEIATLLRYGPTRNTRTVWNDASKSWVYTLGEQQFRQTVKAIEGRTYALRAISFDEADVLVVFQVIRKDTDGSVVLFWKLIETFPKPRSA